MDRRKISPKGGAGVLAMILDRSPFPPGGSDRWGYLSSGVKGRVEKLFSHGNSVF